MAKTKYIEAFEEQYTKKDTKSVLRYKAPDNKWRYVQTSKDASGGNMPSGGGMTEVTWQELKDKRDNGELNPGSLYHITDYNCTTTQENTQSAGHQFDIVLLALSANKLAEEGWAMMHENDTYFANSNLSAWKVWYCLDNDKSRFAWADDSVDEGGPASIMSEGADNIFVRDHTKDQEEEGTIYYGWYDSDNGVSVWTTSQEPNVGDTVYGYKGGFIENSTVSSYTPAQEGTGLPNGRGVIYRLIDEWNNDVAYDFKNIQFVRPMTDGGYDPNGEDTWVYTFTNTNDGIKDASLPQYRGDLGFSVIYAEANYINPAFDSGYYLPYNVFISDDVMSYNKLDGLTSNNTCLGLYDTIMYGTADKNDAESNSIYIGGKKVLTEE